MAGPQEKMAGCDVGKFQVTKSLVDREHPLV